MVTGQAPVTLELRNALGKKHKQHNQRIVYTPEYISQLTQFMPPPKTYKSEIGSQSTMCQVYIGAYVSLLAPEKSDYNTACHPRKTTTYILHVVSITSHTHGRRKSIGENKQKTNKKIEERKERRRERKKKTKKEREIKEKTRKARKFKRQDKRCMQGRHSCGSTCCSYCFPIIVDWIIPVFFFSPCIRHQTLLLFLVAVLWFFARSTA